MPRGPRLDALGVLHHVMVRGIERRPIFRDDADRADFVARLAELAQHGAVTVYAWALLPNHAHLLVRTGTRPLSRSLLSLLTGYAGTFNRRYKRTGRLFQNRYKSIVVEEEAYLLGMVRYLHLNPLRAGVVSDLRRFGATRGVATPRYSAPCPGPGRPHARSWADSRPESGAPAAPTASSWRPASPRAGAPNSKGAASSGAWAGGRRWRPPRGSRRRPSVARVDPRGSRGPVRASPTSGAGWRGNRGASWRRCSGFHTRRCPPP
jgi:REP element-mobilizing transposase RayT